MCCVVSRYLSRCALLAAALIALPAAAADFRLDVGTLADVKPGDEVSLPIYTTSQDRVGGIQVVVQLQAVPETAAVPVLRWVETVGLSSADSPVLDLNPDTREFLAAWPRGARFPDGEALRLHFTVPEGAPAGAQYRVTLNPRFVITTDFRDIARQHTSGSILVAPAPSASDTSAPTAVILSPTPGESVPAVVPVRVDVFDSGAGASGLNYALLEVGEGETPAFYRPLAFVTEPLQGAEMIQWDTTGLSGRQYTLRLTAQDRAGNTVRHLVPVIRGARAQGDVDGNGLVNVDDVVEILKILVRLRPAAEPELTAAELDGDGKVTVLDAIKLLKRLVGLES